jgi:signal transduction histidine kinase
LSVSARRIHLPSPTRRKDAPLNAPPIPAPRTRRDLLRYLAEGTAGVVGDAFLRSLVTHLAAAFGADAAFVAELAGGGRARTLAAFAAPEIHLPEGFEFDLAGTPCEAAYADGEVLCPAGAPGRWPADRLIGDHRLEGYVAVALTGSGGAQIGHIGVMARRGLEASPDELAVMRIFAARAAAEIERRRQAAELAAQRARVIEAADEERRRIGRDLHDGAQQRLVALGQYIDLARRKAEGDPDEADRMLGLAREQATLAGAELRDLVRGLHPVALERGLDVALASLAMQGALELTVEALPERRLPTVVEATVWFVVSEGLTNAVRHAGATELRVRVEERDESVRVTVADDGAGGACVEAGTGLLGLSARIEALGGALAVESPAGAGTRLEATIPLA